MLNKKVEIKDENNFYDMMIGTVIKEEPKAVLVSIDFAGYVQEVYFFNDQLELITE